jgi:hypothetical protein
MEKESAAPAMNRYTMALYPLIEGGFAGMVMLGTALIEVVDKLLLVIWNSGTAEKWLSTVFSAL